MAIALRKPADIQKLTIPNKIVAKTLEFLVTHIKPGISLLELNALGEEHIISLGGRPSFKGLYGFPAGVCTSVNEVIIHGIPTEYKLQEGDIVGLDIGVEVDGWYGDAAITKPVGTISKEDQALIDCSYDCLMYAQSIIKEGMRFKELSYALEQFIQDRGYVPLRSYCGHGIGRKPHEEPEIPNYLDSPNKKAGPKIKNGMVFCIEPMIAQKDGVAKVLDDKWSVVASDGLKGSHYEHTMAVVGGKAQILTLSN
jgi:methionyl aminopeptidase